MANVFNVEPDEKVLCFTQGDTIDVSFSVALNGGTYDIAGMQLDLDVIKRGALYRTFSSAGTSPEITISTSTFNVSGLGFADRGRYEFFLHLTDGSVTEMITRGDIIVNKRTKI